MQKKTGLIAAFTSCLVCLAFGIAFAQQEANPGVTSDSTQSSTESTTKHSGHSSRLAVHRTSDRAFAKEAAEGGLAEVKLGQLAQDKGSSSAVKEFGKRMVDDHSKANDQLKQVASQKNITLPTELSRKDQATYDRLSKLSGAAFDRAYARDMVNDHQKDVAAFEREANNGKDNDIKNFASQTLPTLQDHLKQARQMRQEVSQRASSGGGTQ